MPRLTPRLRQAGFSLVEILVALVAGLVLSAGIFQVFLSSKQTYQVGEQMSRLQENSRHAIDILHRDVRMAGSRGCGSTLPNSLQNTITGGTPFYYNFLTPVQGFEAADTAPGKTYAIPATPKLTAKSNWSPALQEVDGSVVEGTDVLVIRGRRGDSGPLTALNNDTLAVKVLPTGRGVCQSGKKVEINGICPGDYAMVADCVLTRIFAVTDVADDGTLTHGDSGNGVANSCANWTVKSGPSPCRNYPFQTTATAGTGAPAEVTEVATVIFFVGYRNNDPANGPSLYRKVGSNDREELVEGVESMQILYGVSTGGGTIGFVTASDLDTILTNNPAFNVVSVRIGLLMRTVDPTVTTADTSTFDVNGTTLNPPDDRRLRRRITTTIGIRTNLN